MKRLIVMVAVVAAVSIASPCLASDGAEDVRGGWCQMTGTFVGESPVFGLKWTLVSTTHSIGGGSAILQFLGGDPTFGGFFPTVVRLSDTKGVWRRTGARTWEVTGIHYGLDAAGQPVYIGKLSATNIFAQGCEEFTSDGTFALYDVSQDPLGDEPPMYGCYPSGQSFARRMSVEPPCVP